MLHVPAIVLSEIRATLAAAGQATLNSHREAVGLYRQWPGIRISPVDEMLGGLAAVSLPGHAFAAATLCHVSRWLIWNKAFW